jgi:16S rRNA (guanine(966)-N(2))-methyltransferase RsmD
MRNKIRIIGGQWRSRILTFPDGADLRPTPDRVRETVFNWLGQDMSGRSCLDLFAGSGAMGFEAASRGAESVVMVESNAGVLRALKFNLGKLGAEHIELLAMDALKFIDSDRRRFDVIFLDPPYRLGLLPKLLPRLDSHLAREGLVYLEGDSFREPDEDWLLWRKGLAGKVHYGLLKSKKNG